MSHVGIITAHWPDVLVRARAAISGGFSAAVALLLLAALIAQPASAQTHETTAHAPTSSQTAATGQTILGDVIPFGNGTARSWVLLDHDGNPSAVGITLTEAALEGLPYELAPGHFSIEEVVRLPGDIALLPFDHIGLDWNPKGHEPPGMYDVPHFDFHFYMISPEQRSQITARGEDLERCSKPPEAAHIPDGYIYAPESEVPGMGGHWVDPTSHEFHGEAFTASLLFGTYDGKVIFWEPMITMAYLESKPDVTIPMKTPQQVAEEGYYPASYSIRYDASRKEYTVSFDEMTLRQASAAE